MTKLCKRGKKAADSKFGSKTSAYKSAYGVKVCKGDVKGNDGKKVKSFSGKKKKDSKLNQSIKRIKK